MSNARNKQITAIKRSFMNGERLDDLDMMRIEKNARSQRRREEMKRREQREDRDYA